MSEAIRVYICDRDHPHYGEHGLFTGKVISVLGTAMAEVKLDACRHGTDGCFVKRGQVVEESALPVTGGRKRRKR